MHAWKQATWPRAQHCCYTQRNMNDQYGPLSPPAIPFICRAIASPSLLDGQDFSPFSCSVSHFSSNFLCSLPPVKGLATPFICKVWLKKKESKLSTCKHRSGCPSPSWSILGQTYFPLCGACYTSSTTSLVMLLQNMQSDIRILYLLYLELAVNVNVA